MTTRWTLQILDPELILDLKTWNEPQSSTILGLSVLVMKEF